MLEKKIAEDLKAALKEKNQVKVSSLRMLISEIKNKKIEDRIQEMEDSKVISVIQKMAKQHKESIEKFREGARNDLVAKEKAELAVLDEYMPEAMSEEELAKIVDESIAGTGASSPADMGKVMKEVLSRTAGRADGKVVSQMVREKLQKGAN